MIMFPKSENEYDGQIEPAQQVIIDGEKIGELVHFSTRRHDRNWTAILCMRLGFGNAQFDSRESAVKYMKLCAYAEAHELKI